MYTYCFITEYETLKKLGISDPQGFFKRHMVEEQLILLRSVAVGPTILDQVTANVEEVIASATLIDILPLLPSIFTEQDIKELLKLAIGKRSKCKSSNNIYLLKIIEKNFMLLYCFQ